MAAVLLDSTVLIDLLRGRPGTLARMRAIREAGDLPATCAINVEEVHRGLTGASELESAARLFAGLTIIPLLAAEGERAGTWRREHASKGVTLTQADCLVAAAAVALGGRLATGNPKDFLMLGVAVEHWPVGD